MGMHTLNKEFLFAILGIFTCDVSHPCSHTQSNFVRGHPNYMHPKFLRVFLAMIKTSFDLVCIARDTKADLSLHKQSMNPAETGNTDNLHVA